MGQTQSIENYEVAFGDDQGEGLLTFDLADVVGIEGGASSETMADPSALRLFSDKVEVDFGSELTLVFPKLPAELHAQISPLKGIWVCGLRGEEIQVADEVVIEKQ